MQNHVRHVDPVLNQPKASSSSINMHAWLISYIILFKIKYLESKPYIFLSTSPYNRHQSSSIGWFCIQDKMGGSSPCASCKLLRRRCAEDCIFAPYFPSNDPLKFSIVHKVFGASNVSKILQELPVHQRADAISSLVYEANARVRDPVYGCVGAISYLQNQVSELQTQLAVAQAEMLCIQMQHEQPANLLPTQTQDETSFLFSASNNFSNFNPQYMNMNFASGNVNQDPLKTESLWT